MPHPIRTPSRRSAPNPDPASARPPFAHRFPRRRSLNAIGPALAAGLLAASFGVSRVDADDETPFVLLDRSLDASVVRLLSLDAAGVRFRDARGLTARKDVRDLAAILPEAWLPHAADRSFAALDDHDAVRAFWTGRPGLDRPVGAPRGAPRGIIELADGQRFVGWLAQEQSADPDFIAWRHTHFNQLRIPLDNIRSITFSHDTRPTLDLLVRSRDHAATPAGNDSLLLANGDRLTGFIQRIADTIDIETDAGLTQTPASRVATITLANPAKRLSGLVVWLADGTVARVDAARAEPSGQLTLSLDPALASNSSTSAAAYETHDLLAATFDTERLLALASLPIRAYAPIDRPRSRPPRAITSPFNPLGAHDIEIPGPMTIDWDLPPSARAFAAWAELPERARLWGDCVLAFSVAHADGTSTPLDRKPLNRDSPVQGVTFKLPAARPGDTLRLTLDPGDRGPIQDRVTLHRAIFHLAVPAAASSPR